MCCKHLYSLMFIVVSYGQVPQTGLLAFVSAEDVAKLAGSANILVTHQLVKSSLNEVVLLNILCILVTFEVFHLLPSFVRG